MLESSANLENDNDDDEFDFNGFGDDGVNLMSDLSDSDDD